jgi:hypothetical protein
MFRIGFRSHCLERTSSFGMHHSFGNPFPVEVRHFVEKHDIFQEEGAARAGGQNVGLVADGAAGAGGQSSRILGSRK